MASKNPVTTLRAMRAHFEKESAAKIKTFSEARNALSQLRYNVTSLHKAAKQGADYCIGADLAWQIASLWSFAQCPDRPDASAPMSMEECLVFIGTCRGLFNDRSRREYWELRYDDWMASGRTERGFVAWHLANMRLSWDIADPRTASVTDRARVRLDQLRAEFEPFHRLWVIPNAREDDVDYLPVAIEAHRVVADALPRRPEAPSGERVSWANFLGDVDTLLSSLRKGPPRRPSSRPAPPKRLLAQTACQRIIEEKGRDAMSLTLDRLTDEVNRLGVDCRRGTIAKTLAWKTLIQARAEARDSWRRRG